MIGASLVADDLVVALGTADSRHYILRGIARRCRSARKRCDPGIAWGDARAFAGQARVRTGGPKNDPMAIVTRFGGQSKGAIEGSGGGEFKDVTAPGAVQGLLHGVTRFELPYLAGGGSVGQGALNIDSWQLRLTVKAAGTLCGYRKGSDEAHGRCN